MHSPLSQIYRRSRHTIKHVRTNIISMAGWRIQSTAEFDPTIQIIFQIILESTIYLDLVNIYTMLSFSFVPFMYNLKVTYRDKT